MKLSDEQQQILQALADGATLKSHRHLDGTKEHKLHWLTGESKPVAETVMDTLKRRRLIDSNKKFPAATYLLTEKGKQAVKAFSDGPIRPLTAKNYGK